MVECQVLKLSVDSVEESELGLGPSVSLALVEDILRHLVLEHRGGLRFAENAVLAEAKEAFEEELADREANDELLPRKQRAIEEAREALL